MFATSDEYARELLEKHGVYPVDLGAGRGKGLRWLESECVSVLQEMYAASQPEPPSKPRRKKQEFDDVDPIHMSAKELTKRFSNTTKRPTNHHRPTLTDSASIQ